MGVRPRLTPAQIADGRRPSGSPQRDLLRAYALLHTAVAVPQHLSEDDAVRRAALILRGKA